MLYEVKVHNLKIRNFEVTAPLNLFQDMYVSGTATKGMQI